MDRQPPHSRDAEAYVLGSVFVAPAILDEIADLREDDFFLPHHRAIWEAMKAVRSRGRAVDVLSVGDELRARGEDKRLDGGVAYLNQVANEVPTVANVGHYVRLVRERSLLRRVIAGGTAVVSRAFGDVEASDVLSELRQMVAELEVAGASGGPVRVGTLLGEAMEVIQKRASAPAESAVMSGIGIFDIKIGGFKRGQVVVIAGPPGGGKSAFAGAVAEHNAMSGIPSLVFSLEMDRQELVERHLARQSKIAGIKLATGRLNYGEWRTVTGAAGRLAEPPLWIDDRDLSLSQLVAEVRRWHAKHVTETPKGLGVVVVDYLTLIRPDRDERTREREVAKMSRELKGLAKSLRIPILVLSQLSREHAKQNRKPILQDLRESGAVEQDADMVIFPWRDADMKDEHGSGPAELIVAKHRGGPTGTIDVWFDAPWMTYTERQRHSALPYAD